MATFTTQEIKAQNMNTKAEILEAIKDYNNGTFAKY